MDDDDDATSALLLPPSHLSVRMRGTITQVARAHLPLCDPDRKQVVSQVTPPPRRPFLSSCCLTGRKDAVCRPQAHSLPLPFLTLTRKNRLLIPGSSLFVLTSFI